MSEELARQLEEQATRLRASAPGGMQIPAFKSFLGPAPAPPSVTTVAPLLTMADVQAEVQRQLHAAAAQAAPPVAPADQTEQALMALLSQSIAPTEMDWVRQHIKDGAPAFVPFMQSDTVKTLMRMGYEAYREFSAQK